MHKNFKRNLEHHNERERWTRYKQVCYENECCTESKEQEPVNTSSFESAEDQIVGCKALGGYHLNRSIFRGNSVIRILFLEAVEIIKIATEFFVYPKTNKLNAWMIDAVFYLGVFPRGSAIGKKLKFKNLQ